MYTAFADQRPSCSYSQTCCSSLLRDFIFPGGDLSGTDTHWIKLSYSNELTSFPSSFQVRKNVIFNSGSDCFFDKTVSFPRA